MITQDTTFIFVSGGLVQDVIGPAKTQTVDFDCLESCQCPLCFGEINEQDACQDCNYDWNDDTYKSIMAAANNTEELDEYQRQADEREEKAITYTAQARAYDISS